MKELGPCQETEVVLAFLQAEVGSPNYTRRYRPHLPANITLRELLDEPDLTNAAHNKARATLLRSVRGYPDAAIFSGFPRDVNWRRVELESGEAGRLLYLRSEPWMDLSPTRRVIEGAGNVDRLHLGPVNQSVRAIAADMRAGRRYPELVAVEGEAGRLIVMEGNTRVTAHVYADLQEPFRFMLGSSPYMSRWIF
jgi:hypothetical protein